MQAVILVGGKGTRLRDVISSKPKSMADIGGLPFLRYLIIWLANWGITNIVLCTGYMANYVLANLHALEIENISLSLSVEDKPLGTGGALKNAEDKLVPQFLLLNGDSFCDIDLKFLERHHSAHDSFFTFALVRVQDASGKGLVDIDQKGILTKFAEKEIVGKPGLVSSGIYVVEKKVLDYLPSNENVSLERELFPKLLTHEALSGVVFHNELIDIGTPSGYAAANEALPKLFKKRGWL